MGKTDRWNSLRRFWKNGLNGTLGPMKFPSLRYPAFAALLLTLTGHATAIGLGELRLHSTIGQALSASVTLEGTDGGLPDVSCFQLSNTGSEGKRIDSRLRLIHGKGRTTLEISSRQIISEPVLNLLVTIACDTALQREYTLLPDFPVDRSSDASASGSASGSARLAQANTAEAATPPVRPSIRRKSRPATAGGDRLLLSAAPVDLPAGADGASDALPEMNHRMVRRETDLRQLSQSLAALDEAARLGEQKAAVRQELRIAESLQTTHLAVPTPNETRRNDSLAPWLQMTGSALLGGLLSVGLLHLVERRRKSAQHPA